jgi:hypothetical protein
MCQGFEEPRTQRLAVGVEPPDTTVHLALTTGAGEDSAMPRETVVSCPETCEFRKFLKLLFFHCIHVTPHYLCIVDCLSYRIHLVIIQLSNQYHLHCLTNIIYMLSKLNFRSIFSPFYGSGFLRHSYPAHLGSRRPRRPTLIGPDPTAHPAPRPIRLCTAAH